jgi:hypothetical protein
MLGWGCYFKFNCEDSIIQMNESIHEHVVTWESIAGLVDVFHQPSEALVDIDREMMTVRAYKEECDPILMTPNNLASVASQYIWNLNDNVSEWLQLHAPPYELVDNEFIAIQIRLTDKKREMGEEAWRVLSNPSALVDLALPYAIELNISTIFVATDDCRAFESLRGEIRSRESSAEFRVLSACLDSEANKNAYFHGARTGEGGMRLVQDLEILRRSAVLIGTLYSNVLRIAYRLRYPDHRVVNVADEHFSLNKTCMIDFDLCWHYPRPAPGSVCC